MKTWLLLAVILILTVLLAACGSTTVILACEKPIGWEEARIGDNISIDAIDPNGMVLATIDFSFSAKGVDIYLDGIQAPSFPYQINGVKKTFKISVEGLTGMLIFERCGPSSIFYKFNDGATNTFDG